MTTPAKAYQRTPEPGNPARSEAWALLEAARKLNQTKDGPIDDFRAALRANWRLWTIFQASLIEPDCTLPAEVRGNLLGLANFIDKTTVELLAERDATKIDSLVFINRQISEGLMEGARAGAANLPAPTANTAATNPPAAPTPGSVSIRQSA
jgi:flagellar protein FlaF